VGIVYRLTQNEFFRKDFELVKQARGSAISSMANIAEGFHRNSTRDFLRFLDYSRASVAETVSHCYIASDQQYINKSELESVKEQADIVGKKVNNFIAYLNSALTSKKPTSSNQTNQTSSTNQTSKTSSTSKTSKLQP